MDAYGYAAIFVLLLLGIVGLPVPDETLLVFSGYLIFKGRLNPVGALAAALLGSMSGISCSYALGRGLGLPLIHSKIGRWLHITDRRLDRVHDWFERLGHWALFFGYFIPGVRHFTAILAGTSRLEFRPFALYAYSGARFWVAVFVFLGWHFGEQWEAVIALVERNLRLASMIAGGVAVCYLAWRYAIRKSAHTK